MKDPKQKSGGNGGDDDMYVLDDTGDSTIEDIEPPIPLRIDGPRPSQGRTPRWAKKIGS